MEGNRPAREFAGFHISHSPRTDACVSLGAGATEGFESILADASVEARLRVALVHLVLAVRAGETQTTAALITVDLVCARPPVETGAMDIT